ncbi:dTDP-4-dehydrorhamnose reductase [Winogradskyella alexanderae]|uniref:dTDP-4-dehydrorhamnose reductase n=1 Tax=Winogradskyella alexanderae TaxID=2877123 RepID=A0ABS7XPH3_9FLAO|nr:dTDP-4-dehydrorhamnose reductase [Winogradskyella alexanderae]MCA0131289.1 dTDP-4-dehydrorhamnose reductase [Winogradskyella alexanderae]
MPTVLVTGAKGQLGKSIASITSDYPEINFVFASKQDLDITKKINVKEFFDTKKIDWCINCAAYTNVDNAESDYDNAYKVNVSGVKELAEACNAFGVKLVHISTDFVFGGEHNKPYKESDPTNPIGAYGETKLRGEEEVIKILKKHFIIRTSWLYSEYGNNFMKSMLKLVGNKINLNIVDDQIGTPTNSQDLAKVIIRLVELDNSNYGLYHYSNEGFTSWYNFAVTIFKFMNINVEVSPISSKDYMTPAKRPTYSVLDKSKIKHTLGIKIPHWEESLRKALSKL